MVSDSVLILITGSFFTLAASIVSIFVQNYLSQKKEERNRDIAEKEMIIGQVYSPLNFVLMEHSHFWGKLHGNIEGIKIIGPSKLKPNELHEIIHDVLKNGKSEDVRKILITKLGFIKPVGFRSDLFYYFFFLDDLERRLSDISTKGLPVDEAEAQQYLRGIRSAIEYLESVHSSLIGSVNDFLTKKNKSTDAEYKAVFNSATIEALIKSI